MFDFNALEKMQSSWSTRIYEETDEDKIEKYLTFTTKQEYLDWRAEWRRCYKQMSREIRLWKRGRKLRPGFTPEEQIEYEALSSRYTSAQVMLWIRAASKRKAQKQYELARAQHA